MIYHIDMSHQYHQDKFSIVGLVSVDINNHKDHKLNLGVVIEEPVRSILLKDYNGQRLHAAIISLLLDKLKIIKNIVLCNDVRPTRKVISLICDLHPNLVKGVFIPIDELRELTGNKHLDSEPNGFVRNIRRHFNKRFNIHRKKDYFNNDNLIIISDSSSPYYRKLIERLERLTENNR